MLDTNQGAFAVGAFGSLGFLGDYLGYEATAGGFDGDGATAFGGVVASDDCGTFVRHFD